MVLCRSRGSVTVAIVLSLPGASKPYCKPMVLKSVICNMVVLVLAKKNAVVALTVVMSAVVMMQDGMV